MHEMFFLYYVDKALLSETSLNVYEQIAHPIKETVESETEDFYSEAQTKGFANPIYEGRFYLNRFLIVTSILCIAKFCFQKLIF